ncbi:APC family permease [Rhodococcus fascians]|uniref:APC family permease n=1 Tax=Rhodococcoides fascians TaxID=1828 RepID=UPI001C906259|nr:APC family permease [Rhodococcus fascians]MBY3792980.1 APC family permease [Rhodococcus fascians]MBY3825737.1 APC family permease [Rhodococcus fascians]MBY3836199.1 APC family permease [Rhodococcus fascians]MBY3866393.1 APC family permease [Rhodococcus fascians]MBY3884881.1 APC family permease [Rhodococcus fascians]
MSVLAFSSPLTTVAGFIPVLLMFSGHTAPAIYLGVTLLLLVFAVGFTTMGKSVPNPGGFYAFVTAGLGRSAGLGGAFLATFGYSVIGLFAPPFFALTLQSYIANNLGGPVIPWYWLALGIVALTTALAYRRIDLSARVLTTVMVLEVFAVIVFNVASFLNGAPADGGGSGFGIPAFTDPNIGLAILFVVGNFLGFEATVIYREEVKDPAKTIPRATYLAVASIGVFYAVAAWAYIAFLGADNAQTAATDDTAGLFTTSMTALLGKTVVDIVTILLITSILASALSIQNVSARYLFSLGTDGVLPATLGKVHPRHGSPFVSATLIGAIWAIVMIIFAVLGTSPESLYAKASGVGSFAILVLMFGASIAVLVYFWRNRATTAESPLKSIVAPALAAIGLGGVSYLAIVNYSDLIGDTGAITFMFLAITFALPVAGFVLAQILKTRRPDTYLRIGRQKL